MSKDTPALLALDAMAEESIYTKRTITHDEAVEIAHRLINSHFNKEPCARASIPARPDYDDDLLILAFIEQQRRSLADMRGALEATQASELAHSNCEECNGEGEAEKCEKCFPAADDARLKRLAALARSAP